MTTPFAEYSAVGWQLCLIPCGSKSPMMREWNLLTNALDPRSLPEGCNAGLLHAWSGTCALDVDDLTQASAWLVERGVDLGSLLSAPEAVIIHRGEPSRCKLLYRLPAGLHALQTIRVTTEAGEESVTILEMRCADAGGNSVQDVLPPSIHPSGNAYVWAGGGDWRNLPTLPPDLLAVWNSAIEQRRIPAVRVDGEHNATAEELEVALFAVDPSCDRKTWIEIGMVLHDEMGADGFGLWDEWSQASPKYKPAEMATQWRSFKDTHPNPVRVGTLFHYARQAGWQRPPPDLKGMFKAVESKVLRPAPQAILARLAPKVPPLDLAILPPVLANYAAEVSRDAGTDPAVSVLAGLVAFSGAADKRIILCANETWKVPLILWGMTIGDSSDKKTPGSEPMFAPLRKLEAEDRSRLEAELLIWSGLEARHAVQVKTYREWSASPEAALPNAVPPTVETLPSQPLPKRLIITDSTSQKAVTMLDGRPQGLVVVLDEAGNWLSRYVDPRSGDNRSFWTQSYKGGPYPFDRQGTGSKLIENAALSVYGNVQHGMLDDVLDGLIKDGAASRFMFCTLNTELLGPGQRHSTPKWLSRANEYEQALRVVHALPTMEYHLSDEAGDVFWEWNVMATDAARAVKALGLNPLIRSTVGKSQGLALRLALAFHIIDNPHDPVVSVGTMRNAVRFMREFVLPHLGHLKTNSSEGVMRWVIGRVTLNMEKSTISMRDMKQVSRKNKSTFKGTNQDEQVEMIQEVMEVLAGEGIVAAVSKTVWSINPALAGIPEWVAYRDELQRQRADFVKVVSE